MLRMPDQVKAISHKFVSSLYRTMDYSSVSPQSVLVIETQFPCAAGREDSFDTCLLELLADLGRLKEQAEAAIGKIDRIDIRTQ